MQNQYNNPLSSSAMVYNPQQKTPLAIDQREEEPSGLKQADPLDPFGRNWRGPGLESRRGEVGGGIVADSIPTSRRESFRHAKRKKKKL